VRKSARKCHRKFRRKFPDIWALQKNTIQDPVKTLWTNGVIIDKKTSHQCTVLTEETVDNIRAQLEHTPHKLMRWLAQKTWLSRVCKNNSKVIEILVSQDHNSTCCLATWSVARLDFCNYYLQSIHNGKIDPELTFFTEKACCFVS
jgi:hypothetical protein